MRNWKGVLAMGLSAALVIGATQLIPEQNIKNANAETVNNSNNNMTPPSGKPEGTPPAKPDGETPSSTAVPSATETPSDSKITVRASKVLSAKRTSRQTKAVIKVKSVNDIAGYQINYSTSKSFNKKSTKTINSTKNKITISNLSKKNVYYIKVRTYKTINKKKYYSKWSPVKKLK